MILRRYLIGLTAAVLGGVGALSIADDSTATPAPAPKISRARVPAPFSELPDLTDDQKTRIREIHAEILEEEKQLRQKEHDEITAVLTDDQKNELEAIISKATLEKKESTEEKRAKDAEEKAASIKNEMAGAATEPAGNP